MRRQLAFVVRKPHQLASALLESTQIKVSPALKHALHPKHTLEPVIRDEEQKQLGDPLRLGVGGSMKPRANHELSIGVILRGHKGGAV